MSDDKPPAPVVVVWNGTRETAAGPYLSADLEGPSSAPHERIPIDRAGVLALLGVQPMTAIELANRLDLSVVKIQNVVYGLVSAGEIVRVGYRRNPVRGFGQHRKGDAVYGVKETP